MNEYLDFLEACEYAELTALLIEQDIKAEAAELVRDCRVRIGCGTERVPRPLGA